MAEFRVHTSEAYDGAEKARIETEWQAVAPELVGLTAGAVAGMEVRAMRVSVRGPGEWLLVTSLTCSEYWCKNGSEAVELEGDYVVFTGGPSPWACFAKLEAQLQAGTARLVPDKPYEGAPKRTRKPQGRGGMRGRE